MYPTQHDNKGKKINFSIKQIIKAP
jgi:hypothetical protein